MVKVSIEVHDGTARFAVAVLAKSIRQALSIAASQYPDSVTTAVFMSIGPWTRSRSGRTIPPRPGA
jgi:hypothetical protein